MEMGTELQRAVLARTTRDGPVVIADLEPVLALPQSTAEWYVDETHLEGGDEPCLMLWLDAAHDEFKGFTLSAPDDPAFLEMLASIFLDPDEGEPQRPAVIVARTQDQQVALHQVLQPLNIQVVSRSYERDVTRRLDELRPAVIRQFLVGVCLSRAVEGEQFARLMTALDALEGAGPWRHAESGTTLIVDGLLESSLSATIIADKDVRGLAVVDGARFAEQAARYGEEAFEKEALWMLFESRSISGCVSDWPWIGNLERVDTSVTPYQVDLLMAAIEVVLACVTSQEGMLPLPARVRLSQFVAQEGEVTVTRLSPPSPDAERVERPDPAPKQKPSRGKR